MSFDFAATRKWELGKYAKYFKPKFSNDKSSKIPLFWYFLGKLMGKLFVNGNQIGKLIWVCLKKLCGLRIIKALEPKFYISSGVQQNFPPAAEMDF